jgi:saccharopine dehydrogenase (NAD+, L-lysine-forming)
MVLLWLRDEVKKNEKRTALTPKFCKDLIETGNFKINVERSNCRIYKDEDYSAFGCKLVPTGSWKTAAPKEALIIGLKELPEGEGNDFPLIHKHIYFGHCYKNQEGWKELLKRFVDGSGILYDLEFLVDEKGRRVASFGYMAGFAGAAIGIDNWCQQKLAPTEVLGKIDSFPDEQKLLKYIKTRLEKVYNKTGISFPKLMVVGALGRCGTGACDFAKKVGLSEDFILRWDIAETAKGGPFEEILDADIFMNCIYLSSYIPPFLTPTMLGSEKRKLSVIVDVSCDTTNPFNPISVYKDTTTFDNPVIRLSKDSPLDVVAIDHLPSLLPLESSDTFCQDLYSSLLGLNNIETTDVWRKAKDLFEEKVKEAGLK